MTEWKPIETAPKGRKKPAPWDGEEVLICADTKWQFVARYDAYHKEWMSNACIDNYMGTKDATYWKPLDWPTDD